MNKGWSATNKTIQAYLKKEETFTIGIEKLIEFRATLMKEIESFRTHFSDSDLCAMPFINANGYHNKTIAYSIWHIFRIEDIVAHTLIAGNRQVLFTGDYKTRISSPIITTGNELVKQEIGQFSQKLNLVELFHYATTVSNSTAKILRLLTYQESKKKVSAAAQAELRKLEVVSPSENAVWLIDYWCSKDVRGLIQMPFLRHWIMHIEACERIATKLTEQKGLQTWFPF